MYLHWRLSSPTFHKFLVFFRLLVILLLDFENFVSNEKLGKAGITRPLLADLQIIIFILTAAGWLIFRRWINYDSFRSRLLSLSNYFKKELACIIPLSTKSGLLFFLIFKSVFLMKRIWKYFFPPISHLGSEFERTHPPIIHNLLFKLPPFN